MSMREVSVPRFKVQRFRGSEVQRFRIHVQSDPLVCEFFSSVYQTILNRRWDAKEISVGQPKN